ncbi:MAG: hypothetical protein P1U65_16150 [Minwuia sp.]|nr:hypothetical protein [Minwuia sp.]
MSITPFRLDDRIAPDDANDPLQVQALARALREVGETVANDDL